VLYILNFYLLLLLLLYMFLGSLLSWSIESFQPQLAPFLTRPLFHLEMQALSLILAKVKPHHSVGTELYAFEVYDCSNFIEEVFNLELDT